MFGGKIPNEKALFAFCREQEIANFKSKRKKQNARFLVVHINGIYSLYPFVTIKA